MIYIHPIILWRQGTDIWPDVSCLITPSRVTQRQGQVGIAVTVQMYHRGIQSCATDTQTLLTLLKSWWSINGIDLFIWSVYRDPFLHRWAWTPVWICNHKPSIMDLIAYLCWGLYKGPLVICLVKPIYLEATSFSNVWWIQNTTLTIQFASRWKYTLSDTGI